MEMRTAFVLIKETKTPHTKLLVNKEVLSVHITLESAEERMLQMYKNDETDASIRYSIIEQEFFY
jgi:hypothetical protein